MGKTVVVVVLFCFVFCNKDNTLTYEIRNFKPLAIFCCCTAWFVSDLVGNPEDRFSRDAAQLIKIIEYIKSLT